MNPKAMECNILPGIQQSSLVSVDKLSDEGYCIIFVPGNQGVQIVDGNKVKVHVSGEAVLTGWMDHQGLWRVPMEGRNDVALSRDQLEEPLNNVFDLPSIEQTIRYLHTGTGFPTRRTRVKVTKKGIFTGFPMLTVNSVNKYFLESEETVKGHMNHQRQGIRSAKPKDLKEPNTSNEVGKNERNVYAKIVNL